MAQQGAWQQGTRTDSCNFSLTYTNKCNSLKKKMSEVNEQKCRKKTIDLRTISSGRLSNSFYEITSKSEKKTIKKKITDQSPLWTETQISQNI